MSRLSSVTYSLAAVLLMSVAFVASASHAAVPPVVGEWEGAVHPNGANLRLVLHVSADCPGKLVVSLDSVDQGGFGLPASNVVLNGQSFSFDLPVAHAQYRGALSADGKSIDGNWTQNGSLPLVFKRSATQAASTAAEGPSLSAASIARIAGDWEGAVSNGGTNLRLIVHVTADCHGRLTVLLDSIDQGSIDIPTTDVNLKGNAFSFEVPLVHGQYQGTLSSGDKSIDGTWMQGPSVSLVLKRKTT